MEGMRKLLVVLKSTSTSGRSNGVDDVKGDAVDMVKEKLAELLHFLQHIWAYLVSKADETIRPNAASWAHIGLVVVLPVALALLCLYCCRRSLRSLCCCCCCCRRRRMMRAPGRGGAHMPRAAFETDPRGYFINLRAGKELLF